MKYGIDQFKSLCVIIEDTKIIGMNGLDSDYQSFDFIEKYKMALSIPKNK